MNPENIADSRIAGVKSLRLLRPSIIVLCGPAACGKSTFAKRHFRPTQIISSDWARAHICDEERDQRFNAQAFALVHFLVEQRLTVNRLCVVDSTALTAQSRKELLDLAKKLQVPTTLVLFNAPLETCIERDEKRERSVGRAVIERQYQVFEQSKATIRQEGFDQVVDFQEGDLEKIQIEILFRPLVRSAQRPQRSEPVASQRFERSAQPSRPRPSGLGYNDRPASGASVPPAARSGGAPRPATTSVSASKVATPRPGESPASAVPTQPPSAVHPPVSPPNAIKPSSLTPAAAPPNPVQPAAPPSVPAGAETKSGS